MSAAYPFSAVVGMDDLKLALIVNAVSPAVGGVLLRGEKGTAKSTVVRALAELLPTVEVVDGCRFSCDPTAPDPGCPDGPHEGAPTGHTRAARLVELPVGASEDRVVGSLDLERALTEGVRAYEPGLLAGAHRGVLYVDEVNLLHDHLVDLLLDAAALGTSYVEREGISIRHAARFLLVGTMNPEEGELRPQLLDRFGLTVEVAASRDPAQRAEVVRRRLAYEADPEGFAAAWRGADAELAARIVAARAQLRQVVLGDPALRQVTSVCAAFEVDGLRADLVTARAAVTLAAWAGRGAVTAEDVRQAVLLALPHRRRRSPFDAPGLDEDRLDETLAQAGGKPGAGDEPPPEGGGAPAPGGEPPPEAPGAPTPGESADLGAGGRDDSDAARPALAEAGGGSTNEAGAASTNEAGAGSTNEAGPPPEQAPAPVGSPYRVRALTSPTLGVDAPAGRRGPTSGGSGHAIRARRPIGRLTDLHVAATLAAAAPHQQARGRTGPGVLLRRDDLRQAVRSGREGNLVLFVVDASGSMAARARMRAVKEAVLSLLVDAYQRRDKVGLVTFRGGSADVVLPPTSSVDAGVSRLEALATGGRTPLAAGLLRAADVLRVERMRDPRRRPLLVLLTDGRATAGAHPVEDARRVAGRLAGARVASIVVDCEGGPVRLRLAADLAVALGGVCLRLDELAADGLTAVVRDARPRKVA